MSNVFQKGFTLIEMILYASLVSVVAGILTMSLIDNLASYNKSQAVQNVASNAYDALRVITDEIRYAKSIYTPTSVFGSNSGQLSLETTVGAPSGENVAYVDYYLDNGRIYEKRDGQAASPLTSDRVFVTKLLFINQTSVATKDSITVDIDARINTTGASQKGHTATTTIQSSASLRGAY